MLISTFDHVGNKRNADAHRTARLEMLRRQVVQHIQRSDASARKVEQMLATFEAATADCAGAERPV